MPDKFRKMLHPQSGSYDLNTRSMMLEEATVMEVGLAMEIGNSMTRYYADSEITVGRIVVTAPLTYKGMPQWITTLDGPDPSWEPPWEEERREQWAKLLGETPTFSINAAHLRRQFDFSQKTFGPGKRFEGVIDHIRQELIELEEKAGDDPSEWADVIILAFDGALRQGFKPQQILDAILAKQNKNELRVWPDWRTQDTTKAITHDRSFDEQQVGPENWERLAMTSLPIRVVFGLSRHGLETVGDLRKFIAQDPKLMTLRGIGPMARDQIERMLNGEGSLYS